MITVLLAVYNGEKYLSAQLDSLLKQTLTDFKIVIRDDGSTDASVKIIDDYCAKYPQKFLKITGAPTGSAAKNFAKMFELADSDYIMFCDQDDVWLPDKIEKTLSAMRSAENGDTKTPVLVHTDLKVVDQGLNVISPSMFKYQRLNCDDLTLSKLLVQNYITGCTVMVNSALKQICEHIPEACIMHDWWLALVAQLFGRIVCISNPTILYRQHSDNQVGAKASYGINLIKRKLATLDTVRENYNATYNQANLLIAKYGDKITTEQYTVLKAYSNMQNKSKFKKIGLMHKYGFKKGTRLRVIGQYFLM